MKIEHQVCSLQQAKRFKELGVSQESYFVMNPKGEVLESWMLQGNEDEFFAAFTVAELGVMLPDSIQSNRNISSADLIERKDSNEWLVGYDCDSPTEGGYGPDIKSLFLWVYDQTEAQARAAMLISLLENKKVIVEEINDCLRKS